ncbi:hypothetical protein CDAR_438961 [Caerostris darwini]|uniref:Uncharacterized protein n=1 Tax=Caerostris darwini TaxID=1538125 RepID=A0AAV4MM52_9ARAC|nr:hypothetical protein CDAR_438961 [Caerostris darwini]
MIRLDGRHEDGMKMCRIDNKIGEFWCFRSNISKCKIITYEVLPEGNDLLSFSGCFVGIFWVSLIQDANLGEKLLKSFLTTIISSTGTIPGITCTAQYSKHKEENTLLYTNKDSLSSLG